MTPSNPSPDTGAGTPLTATRLPGESPCHFANGLDGWTTCAVHGWVGFREQRHRVLVCPNVNDAARPATDPAGLDALRLGKAMRDSPVMRRFVVGSGDLYRAIAEDVLARLSVADGPAHVYDDPARWGERFEASVADGPGPEERLPRCEHGAIREPCVPCREADRAALPVEETGRSCRRRAGDGEECGLPYGHEPPHHPRARVEEETDPS